MSDSFPGSPRSSDEPRSRYDDLLSTATDLFSRHGYERTTVRMIADELGIQSGSLYSHISGKEEVLKRIVMFVGADFIARADRDRQNSTTAGEALRAMCRSHLDVLHEHGGAVTVYFNEWQKLDAQSQQDIIELRERYERNFADVVAWGLETGEFKAENARAVVLVLLSTLNWTYKWYRPGGSHTPHELADAFLQVIFDGLLPKAGTEGSST